jgi:hypothetical protein
MGWEDRLKRMDARMRRGSAKGLIVDPPAPPPIAVFDQVGKPLSPGDQVVIVTPSVIATVQSVTPVMHPGMPPGTLRLNLHAHLAMLAPTGGMAEGVFQLHTSAEVAQAQHREGGGQPAANEPTVPTETAEPTGPKVVIP